MSETLALNNNFEKKTINNENVTKERMSIFQEFE